MYYKFINRNVEGALGGNNVLIMFGIRRFGGTWKHVG